MLKQKLKICKTCKDEKFIFSNGECKECSAKSKLLIKKPVTKKKLVTLAKLKKEARYWFQRWIRLRDLNKTCIYGSGVVLNDIKTYDACHYLKFELYPEAGFDENNVHGGSKGENIRDCTIRYRNGLISRYSEDFVKQLEERYVINRSTTFKWDRSFLEEISNKYKNLCKDIENNEK